MRLGGVLAGVALSFASSAETWTLERPRPWSREPGSLTCTVRDDGAVELRHVGEADWALQGIPEIKVRPGETFRIKCTTGRAGESNRFSTGVALKDEAGKVVDWCWGRKDSVPGEAVEYAFAVPKGGASILPRIIGVGGFAGVVRRFEISREGDLLGGGAPVRDRTLESSALKVTLCGEDGTLVVEDRRTGRVWRPAEAGNAFIPVEPDRFAGCGRIALGLLDVERLARYRVECELAGAGDELLVSVAGEGDLTRAIDYPAPFASRMGDRLIVPLNEGVGYPVGHDGPVQERLVAYGGHGICMAFFGVQADADGAGWMAILETPDDAVMKSVRTGPDRLWTAGPEWVGQKSEFGYVRKVRYVFLDRGGYVAMCKRYRRYAKDAGRFKSFREKAKERPDVDRLLGAVNVWYWGGDKLSVVSNLVESGIDRFLWSGGGLPDEVKAIAAMPRALVGRYDVYQDVYRPEQLRLLGRKEGANTEAWPCDVVWNSADSNDWRHAWGVKAKDGTWTYCAMMCDRVAPEYARRNVRRELAEKPYNTRFVDTTVASPWQECWNPAHPMTRGDSRRWKMELLRILGDEFGLVVGSETGHDASVPFCDYFEGMLSLGPYRVPDAGRNIMQVWTNAPSRVVEYQVGEKYRLPLWELVYHDCVCAHWYWGDNCNKIPSVWWKRNLFNVLYGTMGMFCIDKKVWEEHRERFVESYRMTSPVARATGYSEMLDHRVLSADRSVQRTVFSDGTEVTVNFGDAPFKLPDGFELPPRSHRVSSAQ